MAITTILEFFETHIQVLAADITKGGRALLKAQARLDITAVDDGLSARRNATVSALKEFIKVNKIPQGTAARVILPKTMVMVRKVTLPSIEDNELAGMARFEAERHIPMNADRQIISYSTLSKNGVEGSEVVLAAVDHAIVTDCIEILKKSGLAVESTQIGPLVLLSALNNTNELNFKEHTSAIVCHIGNAVSDITISHSGNFLMTRSSSVTVARLLDDMANAGLTDIDDDILGQLDAFGVDVTTPDTTEIENSYTLDSHLYPGGFHQSCPDAVEDPNGAKQYVLGQWLTVLLKDIRRTVDFARREFEIPVPNHLVITGVGATIPRLTSYIKSTTGLNAEIFSPAGLVEDKGQILSTKNARELYAIAICSAIQPDKSPGTIDLVLPEYVAEGRRLKQRQSWIVTGVLAAVLLVLAYLFVSDIFQSKQSLLEQYEKKNKEMKAEVAVLNDKDKRLKLIQAVADDKLGALKILEFLSSQSMIPNDITLTSFQYKKGDKDGYVKITGHGKTNVRVNEFLVLLENSPFFEKVTPDPTTNNDEALPNRNDRVKTINVTCTLKKDSKTSAQSKTTGKKEK